MEVACRGPAVSTARTAPSLAAAGRVAARHWPVARRVAAGAAVTGGPAAERQVCCDLNDRLRRFVVNMVRPVSRLHSCLSSRKLRI